MGNKKYMLVIICYLEVEGCVYYLPEVLEHAIIEGKYATNLCNIVLNL